MLDEATRISLCSHLERHLGPIRTSLCELIPEDLNVDIEVVELKDKRGIALITEGMSEHRMDTPDPVAFPRHIELFLVVPSDWPIGNSGPQFNRDQWPVDWLQILAKTPYEHDTWFGVDHTVPNGDPPEPLGEGTEFCCWMIREPILMPPEFRMLQLPEKTIAYYALVPLYRDEMEFALEHGHEALAVRLEEAGVTEMLNVGRPSVC